MGNNNKVEVHLCFKLQNMQDKGSDKKWQIVRCKCKNAPSSSAMV